MSTSEQTMLNTTTLKHCPLKHGDHKIWMCNKFKKQSANESNETLKKLKLCFCCLNSHVIKDCQSERVCGVNGCTKKHNRNCFMWILKCQRRTIILRNLGLKTGPAVLHCFQLKTRFFTIDAHLNRQWQEMCRNFCTWWYWIHSVIYGSNFSSIASVARQWISHVSSRNRWFADKKTEVVTAKVGPSETETIGDTLTFCSHPNLKVGDKKYDFKTLEQKYDYLSNFPDIETSMNDVTVKLGQDAYHLTRPLEYKPGEKNQPWALKTALVWTVSGALPKKETSFIGFLQSFDSFRSTIKANEDMVEMTFSSVCNVIRKTKEEKRWLSILEETKKQNVKLYEVGISWAEDEPICQTITFLHTSNFFRWKNGWRMMLNWKLLTRRLQKKISIATSSNVLVTVRHQRQRMQCIGNCHTIHSNIHISHSRSGEFVMPPRSSKEFHWTISFLVVLTC